MLAKVSMQLSMFIIYGSKYDFFKQGVGTFLNFKVHNAS